VRRFAPLAVVLLLAACGGEGPVDTPPPGGSGGLVVVFSAEIRAVPSSFAVDLACDPPGGDVLDPVKACRALERQPALLVPVPAAPCDSPPTEWSVEITGLLHGARVDAAFDSCHRAEVERWMAVVDFDIPEPGI
jgi:hypothetical protein